MSFSYEQIDHLMNFGFTPDQIMALARDKPEEETPEPEQPETATPEPEEAKPETATPEPEEPKQDSLINELKNEFRELKSTIQKQNILTQSVESIPGNAENTESILAGIIRPVYDNRGGNIK